MPRLAVRSVVVRFRAFPKELAAWKRAARADAMTLSTWLRDSVNQRLDEPPIGGRSRPMGAKASARIASATYGFSAAPIEGSARSRGGNKGGTSS